MINIDLASQDHVPAIEPAPDIPGINQFLLRVSPECDLLISWEQLKSIYEQAKPWFVETERS